MKTILNYLSDLENNNNREWYHAHKDEHKIASKKFENLVQDFILEIGKTDNSILHNIPKELTFRLARDLRFSMDKSPYNPSFRAHISSKGKLFIPVGYFIFIKPGNRSFLAGGLFADSFRDATTMVRDYIVKHGEEWDEIINEDKFKKYFTVKGSALKNIPRGYDANNPQGEFLKNKSWYVEYPISDEQLLKKDFVHMASEIFVAMQPFNGYLNKALIDFKIPKRPW